MSMKDLLSIMTELSDNTKESVVLDNGKTVLTEGVTEPVKESVKPSFKNIFNSMLNENQVTTRPLQTQGQVQVDVGGETQFVAKDQQSANLIKQQMEKGDIQPVKETEDDEQQNQTNETDKLDEQTVFFVSPAALINSGMSSETALLSAFVVYAVGAAYMAFSPSFKYYRRDLINKFKDFKDSGKLDKNAIAELHQKAESIIDSLSGHKKQALKQLIKQLSTVKDDKNQLLKTIRQIESYIEKNKSDTLSEAKSDFLDLDVVGESKLTEKAVSKSQQQAAGAALAAKRGDAPKSKLKGASKEMAKMSTKELEKFAGTKHKGLPDKKKTNEAQMPTNDSDFGAGLGAGRNSKTLESKKAKPDFLDLDGDGNKKESMKKAAADKQKVTKMKKTNESIIDETALSAELLGRAREKAAQKWDQISQDRKKGKIPNTDAYRDQQDALYAQEYRFIQAIINKLKPSVIELAQKEANTGRVNTWGVTGDDYQSYTDKNIDYPGFVKLLRTNIPGIEKLSFNVKGKPDSFIKAILGKSPGLDRDTLLFPLMRHYAAAVEKTRNQQKYTTDPNMSRSNTYEAKKAKPDFLDGNKKESMKKAATDKKKKAVKEGANPAEAARLLGKAHALGKDPFACKYEAGTPEAQAYLDGYKEGLDECFGSGGATIGSQDVQFDTSFDEPFGTDDMEGEMSVFDGPQQEPGMDMMTFEAWDRQLNELLNEGKMKDIDIDMQEMSAAEFKKTYGKTKAEMKDEGPEPKKSDKKPVKEGISVSVSKGNQDQPDSVTVSAQDQDADALLGLLKNAGLGLFGDDAPSDTQAVNQVSDYGAPTPVAEPAPQGDFSDHDSMLALMKTVSANDYEDEESGDDEHVHGHQDAACDVRGEAACDSHEKGKENLMGEEESEDQMEFEVAEDNAPDSDEAETTADEDAEAEEDQALAGADSGDEEEIDESSHSDNEEELNEWANDAGYEGSENLVDNTFEEDIDFMTKFISGGLNKQKQDQTTLPHTRVKVDESIDDWKKLSGIK